MMVIELMDSVMQLSFKRDHYGPSYPMLNCSVQLLLLISYHRYISFLENVLLSSKKKCPPSVPSVGHLCHLLDVLWVDTCRSIMTQRCVLDQGLM